MSEVNVVIKELKCIKTEDPNNDELYFFASAGSKKTKNSKTRRRIKNGDVKKNINIDPINIPLNKDNLLILTAVEQRFIRDDREKVIEQLELFAEKASIHMTKAVSNFLAEKGVKSEKVNEFIETTIKKILAGAPAFFKEIFKDTPLFALPLYIPAGALPFIKEFKVDTGSPESLTKNRFSYEITVTITNA